MNKTCSILNIILIVAVLIGDVCYTILGGAISLLLLVVFIIPLMKETATE